MRKGKGRNNGLFPNSLRIISSCLKTVSTNASTVASTVRSAGATVAASMSVANDAQKDQVLWAGFDKLELYPSAFKRVLLLGYSNGFQVLDVEDSSNVNELVSKRDSPVTFLQMQPFPEKSEGDDGFRASHPLLLVVAGDEKNNLDQAQSGNHLGGLVRDGYIEPQSGNCVPSPTSVRFYSLRSHNYVHVLRFRSAVYMVRCSPRIVAVGLAAQIYCFDALTLENKFSVLTHPVPQVGGQGITGVNIGCGPMAVGPRWLCYASNNPMLSNMGRLSPQNLTPSPGVSPSTSPSSGSLVARYAVESSKQLAAGIINLGDMGYKTLSKYYQELNPDGSNSPGTPNSSWKVGRLAAHSTETDSAGMVVVKDFVSRAIISQFRAHTSPISALCFDPSGTLLVTASVHGNNINIFRIMPSNGVGTHTYDWSSSYVHLYKLYRGITTAVIQDICFSHYSQWIAIVSSKGTCHIFVLSPFGGDTGLQAQNANGDGPTLLPVLSRPWWSTSSCMVNQQCCPPPPPVTLSVVSRIKNVNSGWLNTVSNAASSATGKVSVPSGVVAATFHNSVSGHLQASGSKFSVLEHLLVYTPSGHVMQHELLPSLGVEPSDSGLRNGFGSLGHIQDDESRVKVEPVQWWDVCRRSDWPEREECISGITLSRQKTAEVNVDTSNCEENDISGSNGRKDLVKVHEFSHRYLSNAEVQISSIRIPIWQISKISFYVMSPVKSSERKFTEDCSGGEIEIEKIPLCEIEIRQKDLLPIFDNFHSNPSEWSNRRLVAGRFPSVSSSEPNRTKEKVTGETVISHSSPALLGSMKSSDGGSSRTSRNFLDMDHINTVMFNAHNSQDTNVFAAKGNESSSTIRDDVYYLSEPSKDDSCIRDNGVAHGLSSLKCNPPSVGKDFSVGAQSSNSTGISEVSNARSDHSPPNIHTLADRLVVPAENHNAIGFGEYFQEGYCKASETDECHESTEVGTDADSSSSHCEKEKPEEDGENEDMLGAVFSFSEEG